MKKLLTLIAAAVMCHTGFAQQFSLGLRTGSSYWMDKEEGKCLTNSADGQNTTWDKELFIRYMTKGKLSFEAAMGHYSFKRSETGTFTEEIWSSSISQYQVNERSENIEWNFSAQYELSCPCIQSCPMMKNIRSYVGAVITPTVTRFTTESTYHFLSNDTYRNYKETRDDISIWTGISHTLIYNFSDQLFLTSVLRLQIDPYRFFDGDITPASVSNPDSRIGFQIGVGYNLR